jgi:HPt (histidine-containing phosphotransfer) domain-containing protein
MKEDNDKIKTESYAGYDLTELYKMSNDDKEFVKDMIGLFIKTTSEGLVAIKRGVKNNSWEYVAYQAHKISAPCRHMEAEKLYHLLKKLEDKVKLEYSTLQAVPLVEEIENEINRLVQCLEIDLNKL